jgi:hypothetical protein
VRALVKYQANYFLEYIEIVVDRLLQCSRDPSYEIVHTAEKALENLVTSVDATRCLKVITPYLGRSDAGDETIVLSCVRTLSKFTSRVPSPELMSALGLVVPPLFKSFPRPSVYMRMVRGARATRARAKEELLEKRPRRSRRVVAGAPPAPRAPAGWLMSLRALL